METIVGFAFVLLVPLVIVAGAVFTLFAIGALFDALEHPEELKTRVEGLFRRPPKASQPAPADHYYKPYWAGRG
jgi:hypothetical protein